MGCGVYYNIICSLCVPFLQVCMRVFALCVRETNHLDAANV